MIVRHHHERIDGEGYPDRLAGDDIPLLSRIIAVADAYNAMTSNRAYRDAMPSRVARLRLAQAVESQFDTTAVAAFEAILAGATEEYRTATRADFEPNYADDAGRTGRRSDRTPAEQRFERLDSSWGASLGAASTYRRSWTAFIASAVLDRTPSLSNT